MAQRKKWDPVKGEGSYWGYSGTRKWAATKRPDFSTYHKNTTVLC